MGARLFELYDPLEEKTYSTKLDKALRTCDMFAKSGCDVKILSPPSITLTFGAFTHFADIEKNRPGTVVTLSTREDRTESWGSYWTRDLFQKFKDQIFISRGHVPIANEVFSKLGITSESMYVDMYLGVGGYVVRTGDILVLPDYFKSSEMAKELKNLGYEVFFLPVLDTLDRDMEHLDLTFNMTSTPGGNLLAIVDGNYYRCCHEEVDNLAKLIDAKLHVVGYINEVMRQAPNFVELPDRTVVMSNGCPRTQGFLEKELGKEKVVALDLSKDFFAENKGGGIRCMTNLVE